MTILDVDQFVAAGFAQAEAVQREAGDAARELPWQRNRVVAGRSVGVDAAGGVGGRLVRRHENGPAS
ncbi:hypothetical protein [Microbispora sp. GKU 823]|uniref:hypothetical protein n=1 Tax=Microbispora sp. GKU 823 TaxID=1652100 RepID=UPI0009A3828B|nr:hypothetical protein [Microbispora sp. GKU 823]OPG11141.1 hypothetical protein B1L11_21930 [Microbispora sp. GKU 823]